MKRGQVEINWEGMGLARGTYIKVDGKEVAHVTSVRIDLSVEDVPRIVIECIATDGYLRIDESDVEITPIISTVARKAES